MLLVDIKLRNEIEILFYNTLKQIISLNKCEDSSSYNLRDIAIHRDKKREQYKVSYHAAWLKVI